MTTQLQTQTRTQLPQELLDALPAAVKAQRQACNGYGSPLTPLLNRVAQCYGMKDAQDARWNRLIDYLDRDYPDWRGYPAPDTSNRRLH